MKLTVELIKEVRKAGDERYYISVPKALMDAKTLVLKKEYIIIIKEKKGS